MAVEVRAVDAGEFYPPAHPHPAATAHAGAIDHDRVEADGGLDPVRAGGFGAGLHHDRRTDGDDLVDVGVTGDGRLDAPGHQALETDRPIVGADHEFVADRAELVLPEDQIAAPEADHADDVGAGLLEPARLGINRRHPEAAADADHLPGPAKVARHAHWPDHAEDFAALPADPLHLPRGLADRLDDHGYGALGTVEIGDGEGNALAVIVGDDNDELPRPGRPGHRRVVDLEQERRVGEIRPRADGECGRGNAVTIRAGDLVPGACFPFTPVVAIDHVRHPPPSVSLPNSNRLAREFPDLDQTAARLLN